MKVNVLWLVEYPKSKSILIDIITKVTISGLERQFRGGLASSDVHSIYTDEQEATEVAESLMRRRDDLVASNVEPITDRDIRAYCEAMQ